MTDDELKAIEARIASAKGVSTSPGWIDGDVARLVAEVRRLRAALARLGSIEAFTYAMAIATDDPREMELRARIDFARDAMK